MLPQVSEFFASISLNAELWRRLKTFAESPAAAAITGIHRRFLDETVKDFRQAGADLPAEKRERLQALQTELAQLTQKFSENVLDATNGWQLVVADESKLAGLPERAKAAARRQAEAKGVAGWRFTLHMPSQEPFMTYRSARKARTTTRRSSERSWRCGRRKPRCSANRTLPTPCSSGAWRNPGRARSSSSPT
jgi:oligopeptidase A